MKSPFMAIARNPILYKNNKKAKYDDGEYDFETGDELSDMRLIVENRVIHVHKAILGTVSPVFRRMFTSDFKEKNEGEVTLAGKRYDDIIELLNVVYPCKAKEIDDSKVESLLELSEEYNIMKIRVLTETKLIEKLNELFSSSKKKMYGKTIDNQLDYLMDLYSLSDRYKLKKLRCEVITHLAKQFDLKLIEKNACYSNIEHGDKLEIMRRKLTDVSEKLNSKDKRVKQLEDENLKQKFEINRLRESSCSEQK